MNLETLKAVRAAEASVRRLVEKSGKGSQLYLLNPQAVAQVSRTAKWLLRAIAALPKTLDKPTSANDQKAS
jgi:hypothetical protein